MITLRSKFGVLACMCLILLSAVLIGCNKQANGGNPANASLSNTEVAKKIFGQMADGDTTVVQDIDWDNLKVSTVDVSQQYKALPDAQNKSAFTTTFITSYSKSFKATGATASMLETWTEEGTSGDNITVVGKTNHNTGVRLTLAKKNGSRLLTGIALLP